MGLFKPAWMKNDREAALKAVDRIHTPDELRAILSTETPNQIKGIRALVVIEAAKKLGDDQMLYEMAADRSHSMDRCGYNVRRAAVDALRNQALLARLLTDKPGLDDHYYQPDASELYIVERITEATVLLDVLNDQKFCASHEKVACSIIEKLDEASLYKYACDTPHFKNVMAVFYAAEKRKLSFWDGELSHALHVMLTKGAENSGSGRYAVYSTDYDIKLRYDAKYLEERRHAALEMEKIMRQNERLAQIFWQHVKAYAEAPIHSEVIDNYDGAHDEYGAHGGYTKTFVSGGLGMAFPAK